MNNLALIFPAFGSDLTHSENEIINYYSKISGFYIDKASQFLNINFDKNNFFIDFQLDDELISQYKTYIFSCILSRFLKDQNIKADIIAGYSMGIYAAIYHSESIEFEDGLSIIQNVYKYITNEVKNKKFGMASITGLSKEDINKLIMTNDINAEIINQNNRLSFIVSGFLDDITKITDKAREEGALNTKILTIKTPYHSKYLKDASKHLKSFLDNIDIKKPLIKIISEHDQDLLSTPEKIKSELVSNINTKHSWYDTKQKMLDMGINTFFECGPGKSLLKASKFIDGDFKVYNVKSIGKFLSFFSN